MNNLVVKSRRRSLSALTTLASLLLSTAVMHAQGPQQTITYQSTDDDFLNPERGFYASSMLTENSQNQYDNVRENGDSENGDVKQDRASRKRLLNEHRVYRKPE